MYRRRSIAFAGLPLAAENRPIMEHLHRYGHGTISRLKRPYRMNIGIDRRSSQPWQVGDLLFVRGTDADGRAVVVQMDASAWRTMAEEWPNDPLAGVEALASRGHWIDFGGDRVWRIDLV